MLQKSEIPFIYSGISAFLVYFFVLFLLLFNFTPLFKTKYIPRTSTILEQSIAISISEPKKPKQKKQDKKNAGTPVEGMGIKEMFSNIADAQIMPPVENTDDRSQVAKNTQDKTEKNALQALQEEIEKIRDEIKAMDNKQIEAQSQTISPDFADGKYDEWYGKIYDIIYRKWNPGFYQSYQGAIVTTLVQISPSGGFSYRIVRLSKFDGLNEGVIELLDSFKNESFPPHPEGKSVQIDMNFRIDSQ